MILLNLLYEINKEIYFYINSFWHFSIMKLINEFNILNEILLEK